MSNFRDLKFLFTIYKELACILISGYLLLIAIIIALSIIIIQKDHEIKRQNDTIYRITPPRQIDRYIRKPDYEYRMNHIRKQNR